MSTDILDKLSIIAKCRRCECLSCDRDPSGELHGHICTEGEHCVDTREKLKSFRFAASMVAGAAMTEIRRLRRERDDALHGAGMEAENKRLRDALYILAGDVEAYHVSCTCDPPPTDRERGNLAEARGVLNGYEPDGP